MMCVFGALWPYPGLVQWLVWPSTSLDGYPQFVGGLRTFCTTLGALIVIYLLLNSHVKGVRAQAYFRTNSYVFDALWTGGAEVSVAEFRTGMRCHSAMGLQ